MSPAAARKSVTAWTGTHTTNMDKLNPDRLFPADPSTRSIARDLYQLVKDLPIISPHGHTDPKWFADNVPFADPASLRTATRWDAPGPTLRVHAGLEHPDDLIADLEAGFARFNEINRGHRARTG